MVSGSWTVSVPDQCAQFGNKKRPVLYFTPLWGKYSCTLWKSAHCDVTEGTDTSPWLLDEPALCLSPSSLLINASTAKPSSMCQSRHFWLIWSDDRLVWPDCNAPATQPLVSSSLAVRTPPGSRWAAIRSAPDGFFRCKRLFFHARLDQSHSISASVPLNERTAARFGCIVPARDLPGIHKWFIHSFSF